MTNCTAPQFEFPLFKRRKVEGYLSSGAITSDEGIAEKSVEQCLQLTKRIAQQKHDPR